MIHRYIVGPHEDPVFHKNPSPRTKNSQTKTEDSRPGPSSCPPAKRTSDSSFRLISKTLQAYQHIINRIKGHTRHTSCPHPSSCAYYILEVWNQSRFCYGVFFLFSKLKIIKKKYFQLQGSSKLFGVGIGAQLALQLIFQIKRIVQRPQLLKSIMFRGNNLNLGIFLGGFTGLYRVCIIIIIFIFE